MLKTFGNWQIVTTKISLYKQKVGLNISLGYTCEYKFAITFFLVFLVKVNNFADYAKFFLTNGNVNFVSANRCCESIKLLLQIRN